MIVFLLALISGIAFYASAMLAGTVIGRSKRVQQVSMVCAAGILLAVVLADLLPESFERSSSEVQAALGVALGFITLYIVESLTGGHTHHHEPHDHAPQEKHHHDSCVPAHALLPFIVGLSIHNLADGFVLGAGDVASDATSAVIATGIIVHQLPVGLSFAAVLGASRSSGGGFWQAKTLQVAAMIPLGALLFMLMPTAGNLGGVLMAIAAGSLLYVATGHLLPEAHSEERHVVVVTAFVLTLLGTIIILNLIHS